VSQHGTEIVISTPLRSAIGTFGGALKETPASDLGAQVLKAVLKRSGLEPDQVNQVYVGNVLQGGQGMNPGRQVGVKAGLPYSVPAMTLNRMCGSGLQAVISAAQDITTGDSEVCIAGGIENMDLAPWLLPRARYGYRMGVPGGELLDSMVYDGLWDIFNEYHMGMTAENVADKCHVTREQADEYSYRSHQRATEAMKSGAFAEQIVPIEVNARKGTSEFTIDEHVRQDASLESFHRLKPVFKSDGTVTAGNASGINDGAAFMIVTSEQKAQELGLPVSLRLVSSAVSGVDPAYMGIGPVAAICKALERAGLTIDDVDLFEINEAFAAVAIAIQKELHILDERLNPLGGAVALGHPIGATGAILTVKLAHELERQDKRYGVAGLCIGGGMGIAAVFERSS
jgi:acetyl-CoA C-acetyltransferase